MSTLIRLMAIGCIALGIAIYVKFPEYAYVALPVIFTAPFWWGFATLVDAAELYISRTRKQAEKEEANDDSKR